LTAFAHEQSQRPVNGHGDCFNPTISRCLDVVPVNGAAGVRCIVSSQASVRPNENNRVGLRKYTTDENHGYCQDK